MKMTFLVLLCIVAACSILSLVCAWHLVCNTTGVRALEERMAVAEDKIDSLIVKDGRYGKTGRAAYWEIKRLRKELDKTKKADP